jgi:uncharacterized protein (TIGR03382 family)
VIHDEPLLDGSSRLNLSTFVTTWMEPPAARLLAECADKNMIDKDEYPQTAELERRCVGMLAELWHALEHGRATGCSTTGSSEAAMLAGLALKWRWRARRPAGQRPERPNLVMGANVQVCWEKFCRYFDVEPRLVPVGPDATRGPEPRSSASTSTSCVLGARAIARPTRPGDRRHSGWPLHLERQGPFTMVSRAEGIPVFAFQVDQNKPWNAYELSDALRSKGWLVPPYTLPPALDHRAVLRVVVQNGLSRDMAQLFADAVHECVVKLWSRYRGEAGQRRTTFHH